MVDDLRQLRERIADLRSAIEKANKKPPAIFETEALAICDELETLREAESEDSVRVLAHARARLAESDDLLNDHDLNTPVEHAKNRLLVVVVRLLGPHEEAARALTPAGAGSEPRVPSADYPDEIGSLVAQIDESTAAAQTVIINIDKSDRRTQALVAVQGLESIVKLTTTLKTELTAKLISLPWVGSLGVRLGELVEELTKLVKGANRLLSEIEGLIPGLLQVASLTQKVSDRAKDFLRSIKECLSEKVEPRPADPGSPRDRQSPRPFRDIDEPWCPEMVEIPPGEFLMGSPDDDVESGDLEKPQHLVRISYPLAVGLYPVTFEEYDWFVGKTRSRGPGDEGWGRGRRPVIHVNWGAAKAFSEWLSEQTGARYRLLSEAEWEYAARSGTTTSYWWGDEPSPDLANYGGTVGKTTEVGAYPANPFGLHEMPGNVWEWVEDTWHPDYDGAPKDGHAWTEGGAKDRRVIRGGSWGLSPFNLRSANRGKSSPVKRYSILGFRIARLLD